MYSVGELSTPAAMNTLDWEEEDRQVLQYGNNITLRLVGK